jgi:hypothetical protein
VFLLCSCSLQSARYTIDIDRAAANDEVLLRNAADNMSRLQDAAGRVAMGKDGRDAERVTTTLTKDQNEALERLAKKNGVAKAWLIRRAVERLIEQSEGGPLLPFDLT